MAKKQEDEVVSTVKKIKVQIIKEEPEDEDRRYKQLDVNMFSLDRKSKQWKMVEH